MATDLYLSWQDLLEEDALESQNGAMAPLVDGQISAEEAVSEDAQLPDEILALFEERERLEKELKALAGGGGTAPEDKRAALMFAVKVHTKETRLEERRQRLRDERRQEQAKRILERRLNEARLAALRARKAAERREEETERIKLRERWDRERVEAAKESARKQLLEAKWAARRDARRDTAQAFSLKIGSAGPGQATATPDRRTAENRLSDGASLRDVPRWDRARAEAGSKALLDRRLEAHWGECRDARRLDANTHDGRPVATKSTARQEFLRWEEDRDTRRDRASELRKEQRREEMRTGGSRGRNRFSV
ncbi:hypothetical protein [Methyloterricola oryzae]|uniref:hypothetical protein n=1 Tax=Methyloterricola oryzae TaxID=1495050 RepID=UPI0005EB6BFC|nr:hypothetical protein [Methyloterricola oryzae]